VSACPQTVQGGDTTSDDDEGYVTDPEPEPPSSAALGRTDDAIPDVLPNAAAGGGADGEPTPESVEEFRQRLARKESGAEAGTSGRPGTAFGLEACLHYTTGRATSQAALHSNGDLFSIAKTDIVQPYHGGSCPFLKIVAGLRTSCI